MKLLIAVITILMVTCPFAIGNGAQEDPSWFEEHYGDYPEVNPDDFDDQPQAIDPELVESIHVRLTDGRVQEFVIPVWLFDELTISDVISFITEDSGGLITIYDKYEVKNEECDPKECACP